MSGRPGSDLSGVSGTPDFLWQTRAGVIRQWFRFKICSCPVLVLAVAGWGCRRTVVETPRSTWLPQITKTNLYPTHHTIYHHHHHSTTTTQPPLSFISSLLHLSDHYRLIQSFVSEQNVLDITVQWYDGVKNNVLFSILPGICYVLDMMCPYTYKVWPVSSEKSR